MSVDVARIDDRVSLTRSEEWGTGGGDERREHVLDVGSRGFPQCSMFENPCSALE